MVKRIGSESRTRPIGFIRMGALGDETEGTPLLAAYVAHGDQFLRLAAIHADLLTLERETEGLFGQIIGGRGR